MINIVLGSTSDINIWKDALDLLETFDIKYGINVCSAHRSPNYLGEIMKRENIGNIWIASGGMSFHLAGVIASKTVNPVICVPLACEPFNGMDSLMSSIQMPKGIPVAVMSVGKHGTINGVLFAMQILSLTDNSLKDELIEYRDDMEIEIIESNPVDRRI